MKIYHKKTKEVYLIKNSANYAAIYAKPCLVNVNVRNKVAKSIAQDRPVQGDRHYWSKRSLLQKPKVNYCDKNSKILYCAVSKFNPAHNLVVYFLNQFQYRPHVCYRVSRVVS